MIRTIKKCTFIDVFEVQSHYVIINAVVLYVVLAANIN